MLINTTRFGEIEVNESDAIFMKGAIIGFENQKRFILLMDTKKTPLWWFQCIDDPSVAFVVMNPYVIKPDYAPVFLEGDLELLDIKNPQDIALLSIVTVRSMPLRVTANLRAPILINSENRAAGQVVLDDADLPIQYDVLDKRPHVEEDSSTAGAAAGGLSKIPLNIAAE